MRCSVSMLIIWSFTRILNDFSLAEVANVELCSSKGTLNRLDSQNKWIEQVARREFTTKYHDSNAAVCVTLFLAQDITYVGVYRIAIDTLAPTGSVSLCRRPSGSFQSVVLRLSNSFLFDVMNSEPAFVGKSFRWCKLINSSTFDVTDTLFLLKQFTGFRSDHFSLHNRQILTPLFVPKAFLEWVCVATKMDTISKEEFWSLQSTVARIVFGRKTHFPIWKCRLLRCRRTSFRR
jgi:hypothetical protein